MKTTEMTPAAIRALLGIAGSPTIVTVFDITEEAPVSHRVQECDYCPTETSNPDGLCDDCQAEEDAVVARTVRPSDALARAWSTGEVFDETSLLQFFGDPGDGDLAEYL